MSFSLSINCTSLVEFVFVTGGVAVAALNFRIRTEVNGRLPEHRRWKFWRLWPGDSLQVYRQHRQFFPDSKARLACEIVELLWSPFAIICFVRIYQAIHA